MKNGTIKLLLVRLLVTILFLAISLILFSRFTPLRLWHDGASRAFSRVPPSLVLSGKIII